MRLGQDCSCLRRNDLAVVVDEAEALGAAIQLVQEAGDLRRVALEVQIQDDGG
ncbi:MAG: hypothetical protein KatS3mg113_0812 [Planctomycetaceae bacterium]|nr:MAG: hypothetical protein KatS3mg113_0812 [Planctomycetaceae bacterium]